MSAICRFIHAEKANYPITLLCKAMQTARSTYYAWAAGQEAREARRRNDEALAHEITMVHLASRKNYGVPRVTAALRRRGRVVNHKRVARVMREYKIAGNSRRTGRRSLTKADTKAVPSPDLIGRDFTAARPGTKVVGDITYIPTAEGWLYLASWLDLATREVIGYSMADHHRAELVVDALDMAAGLGRLAPGCVIGLRLLRGRSRLHPAAAPGPDLGPARPHPGRDRERTPFGTPLGGRTDHDAAGLPDPAVPPAADPSRGQGPTPQHERARLHRAHRRRPSAGQSADRAGMGPAEHPRLPQNAGPRRRA